MLSFRTSLIVFALAFTGVLYAIAFHQWSLAWIALLSAIYAGVIWYGSARINSSFFTDTHCAGPSGSRQIALTFDDGPTELTTEVLAILRQHAVPAAFFCIGQRVSQQPAVVQQAYSEGHIIGNHSFSHGFFFDFFSAVQFRLELQLAAKAILRATGQWPALFRPPYGVTTPGLADAIRHGNYSCIGWNVRTMDTLAQNETKLLARAVNALAPGTIFLFHDSKPITVRMLANFIVTAQNQGYEFVGLDHLLNIRPYV